MSDQNLRVVKRIYQSFERDDWSGLDQLFDPEVQLHGTSGGLSEGNVAQGVEAVRQTFDVWDGEAWEEIRLDVEKLIDAGDQVVAFQHERRRGRGSGVEVESQTAVVFGFRDGRVIRLQGFMDRDEALRAARVAD